MAAGPLMVTCDVTPVVCPLERELKGSPHLALTPGRGPRVACWASMACH